MKKKTIKKKTDEIYSKYIRLRDADTNGYVKCITCGESHHWTEVDAGHFVSRNRLIHRYKDTNVNGQCRRCNRFCGGEQYLHGKAIDEKYGEGTAMRLESSRHEITKMSILDYEALIDSLKLKVEILRKEKGL